MISLKRIDLLPVQPSAGKSWARQQGMPDYENLSDLPPDKAVGRSMDILRDGWGHGNKYSKISVMDPIPWDDDGDDRRSWNFHVQSWDMCSDLLQAHSETGDEASFQCSLRIALEWIRHNPSRDMSERSKFAWYDMAVGMRAYRLAYILDVARRRNDIPRDVVDSLWGSLLLHADYLQDDGNICFHNNHGFYQVAGQLAMGRRFSAESTDMGEAYRLGGERLRRMMQTQFTAEGVHSEHSPDYHRMVYGSLKGIISSGLVEDAEIIDGVNNIERALAWFVTPQQTLVNFGDTDVRGIGRSAKEARRKWNTPEMQYMVSGGGLGSFAERTVHAFEESGYFLARSDWRASADGKQGGSYLAQTAAFHSRTHKHADDLSFVWFEHGHPVLIDAGRYGYLGKAQPGSDLFNDGYWYSDPNRVFCESTRAHNTVEIDGRNYLRKGAVPYGSAIKRWGYGDNGISWCETAVTQFGTIEHTRLLVFLPGSWVLVSDLLQDTQEELHDFVQWLHFDPAFEVSRRDIGFLAKNEELQIAVQAVALGDAADVSQIIIGQREPQIQGFHSPVPNSMIPAAAVNFKINGSRCHLATLLSLSSELVISEGVQYSEKGWSVVWEQAGARFTVAASEDGVAALRF